MQAHEKITAAIREANAAGRTALVPFITAGYPQPDEFIATLGDRYGIAVECVDESFTSTAAEESLRAERREGIYNRRLTREKIDQHAACLIAEQWMNQAFDPD